MMYASLAQGALLGLGAAVPIGPVNVEIARRTLAGGFLCGFALGCGAVTVDVTYAALTSLGLSRLLDQQALRLPMLIAGTAILTYLGAMCITQAIRASRHQEGDAQVANVQLHRSYATGVLMTLLNPMTLAFWFFAVPAAGAKSPQSSLPMVCAGVFAGTVAWVCAFAGTLAVLRRFQQRWWVRVADLTGGVILLYFAATTAFAAVHNISIIP
jgi:L-lysine exporter family protein LysE/ArgO